MEINLVSKCDRFLKKNNLLSGIIYIELVTRIIYIKYSIFEYFNRLAWDCSQLQNYCIKNSLIYIREFLIYIYSF